MGYYTEYKLSVEHGLTQALRDALDEDSSTTDYGPMSEFLSGREECKWYDHEADLRAISKKFPEALFRLQGKSEDHNMWVKYFQNGKTQWCPAKITYDPFDPRNLR